MLSIPHLIVIFVVALIIFGPEKLPELARNLGKVMAEFRRATGDLRSSFEGHMRDLEREAQERRTAASAPSPAALPPRASDPVVMAAPATAPAERNNPSAGAVAPENSPAPPDPPAYSEVLDIAAVRTVEYVPAPEVKENPEQASDDGSPRPA